MIGSLGKIWLGHQCFRSVNQDELIGVEQGPEKVLQNKERIGKRREVMTGLLGLLGSRIPAERREINLVDHVELGLSLMPRGFNASGQETSGLARKGVSHELTVHHHERLGDGSLKAGGLVSFIIAEGEKELPGPVFPLLVAPAAAAGLVSVSRREQ